MDLFPTLSTFPIMSNEIKYKFYQMKSLCNPEDPFYEKSHFHTLYEFYMNVSGNVSFLVGNQVYSVESGEIIVCRPGELHNCMYNEITIHEYRCLWIYFEPGSEYEQFFNKEGFNHKYSFDEMTCKAIEQIFSDFAESSTSEQKSRIRNFLSFILKNNQSDQALFSIPRNLRIAIEYINAHYSEIKSISDIADYCYISVPTINRLFKKHMNATPLDFLNLTKLSAAKKLLDNGCSVTEACIQAGFSNCSYFISLFKEQYGTTPHKYKECK